MVRCSSIPCKEIRELRVYIRKYIKLSAAIDINIAGHGKKPGDVRDPYHQFCQQHIGQKCYEGENDPGVLSGYILILPAMTVIAETGADMKAFENSGKFAGWTGLRPGNDESTGKCSGKNGLSYE
ncbi:MAG TPA: transposase [Bacteroidales bacterium]|nr:transposase [Bacteroidales bacterium]HQH24364.1 transposase [Bacteroidales bacterium]HQK70668.1 transposase [Bacteroidales bacterium]